MPTTRRLVGGEARFVGRSWEDIAQELQEIVNRLLMQTEGGIPSGFGDSTPTPITGGETASAGTEGAGWAAADHTHELDVSGTPGEVGPLSAQGGGPGVSLSSHTHRLDIMTTKGDLISHDGTDPVRKAVGMDGLALLADSLESDGLRWGPLAIARDALVADQNDYIAAGAASSTGVWSIVASGGGRNITGILTQSVDGQEVTIFNNGVQLLGLKHQDAGSVAANRLICPGAANVILAQNEAARLIYDVVHSRWRVLKY